MVRVYDTEKGNVIIGQYFVLIDTTMYDIFSEQQSIGEWEDYDTQQIEAYAIADTTTEKMYYLQVFRHTDVLPEETCYSYSLELIEDYK